MLCTILCAREFIATRRYIPCELGGLGQRIASPRNQGRGTSNPTGYLLNTGLLERLTTVLVILLTPANYEQFFCVLFKK